MFPVICCYVEKIGPTFSIVNELLTNITEELWFNRRGVKRRTDWRILKRDFNGFPDPTTAAECGFNYFLDRILDFASNTNIFARISNSGRKSNGRFG